MIDLNPTDVSELFTADELEDIRQAVFEYRANARACADGYLLQEVREHAYAQINRLTDLISKLADMHAGESK